MFGAYLSERIKNVRKYRGNGDAFVFTFHDGEDLEIFASTGLNDKYQMTDEEFLIIGGANSEKQGRAAITICDRLTRGHSSHSETFDNTVLCGDSKCNEDNKDTFDFSRHDSISKAETQGGNFVVIKMEVWGFDIDSREEF